MSNEDLVERIYQEMMSKIWIKTEDKDKYENVKKLIRETALKGIETGQALRLQDLDELDMIIQEPRNSCEHSFIFRRWIAAKRKEIMNE